VWASSAKAEFTPSAASPITAKANLCENRWNFVICDLPDALLKSNTPQLG
jgi:hypothetical protein